MKKIVSLLFILAFMFVLSSCQMEEKKLTIGFMPSLAAVPYIYAEENGFYEKYGLDVQIVIFQKSTDRDAALSGGTLNGVSTDFVGVGTYLENKQPMVVTAETEEIFRLVTSKYYEPSTIEATNQAKVGISENTVVDYLVSKVAKSYSLTYQTIGIPSVPARKAALDSINADERVDMAIMPEPFPTLEVNEGGTELWRNTDDSLQVTCLAFTKAYADHYHEALVQFHQATNEAIESLTTKDYNDYKSIIIKYGILDDTTIDQVIPQSFQPLKEPSEVQFADVMSWMKSKGLITKEYKLSDIQFSINE